MSLGLQCILVFLATTTICFVDCEKKREPTKAEVEAFFAELLRFHNKSAKDLTKVKEMINDMNVIDKKNYNQDTALHKAVKWKNIELVAFLLNHDADLLSEDYKKSNALFELVGDSYTYDDEKRLQTARMILEKAKQKGIAKQVVSGENWIGTSVIYYACEGMQEKLVELLLEYGAEVDDKKSPPKWSALYKATQWAKHGDIKTVQMILSKRPNVNVNYMTESGFTPLYIAVNDGNRDLVKLLLEHGADPKQSKIPRDQLSKFGKEYQQKCLAVEAKIDNIAKGKDW